MEIGFIDFSREERNRILYTLKMLDDRTALDELGIGVVRDAYADILFPGISTLQTRAKYFVLLLYLFQSAQALAEKGTIRNGQALLQWINKAEDGLAAALTKHCPGEIGIIGSNAYRNNRSVKIKPSTIYWSGLRTFGIYRANTSILAACKMLCEQARRRSAEVNAGEESFDDPTALQGESVLFEPLAAEYDYMQDAVIELTEKEAKYLYDRILQSPFTADSLLAFLLRRRIVCDSFSSVPTDLLPDDLRRDYCLARDFSRFIYGAHIRYNVIFSAYSDARVEEMFHAWRDSFLHDPIELAPVLERVSCQPALAVFCRDFLETVRRNDLHAMDDLIVSREKLVKQERAKLRKSGEYRYDPDHPIHLYELDFRFGRANVIIQDILRGWGGETIV